MKSNNLCNALRLLGPMLCSFCLQVESQELDEFSDFYGDADFVSIATGTKKNIDKAPAIASVVTAEYIAKRGARNLAEALAMVPGLNVSRSSQAMAPKFNFRGITSTFSPQTLLMINGVPTTSVVRGDNHTPWGEFPIHAIARIEVIRGPGSALYGADAFAGVINVITKTASDIQSNEFGMGVGSFKTGHGWGNYGFEKQDFSISANVEVVSSQGQSEIIQIDAQTALDQLAAERFSLPPASQAPGTVNTGFDAIDVHLNIAYKSLNIDSSFIDRKNVGTGQGIAEALDPNGAIGSNKFIVSASYSLPSLFDTLSITTQVQYYRSSQEIDRELHIFPAGSFFGAFPDGVIGSPQWKEDRLQANVSGEYTGINGHTVSFGLGYVDTDLFEVTESQNFFSDLRPRPEGLVDVSDTSDAFIPEASRSNRFIFVQDVLRLAPDWELTAGLRFDDYSDVGSTVNPRLALVWSQSLNNTFKLLYGRAFRAPAFAELLVVNNPVALGNTNLKPETINTVELGYTSRVTDDHVYSVNAFYYEIDDFITFVADTNSPTSTAQNLGLRKGYGIEAEANWTLPYDVSVDLNYSYVKARDELLNSDVGDYPNHQIKGTVNWAFASNWTANVSVRAVGERRRSLIDSRNDLGGFTDISLNLQYTHVKYGITTNLAIKNALDDAIFEPSSSPASQGANANIPFDLPQAGRAAYLFVSKQF